MIQILPAAVDQMYLGWNGLAGTTFNVYRSGSPEGNFDLIAPDLTVPFFVDYYVNLYDDGNRYYYKVEGLNGGVVVETSDVATLAYNKADGVANKVIYESRVALRVMNNPVVYILIKKRFGDNCPECWNPVTRKVRYADCKTCFGTGLLAGYYSPIPSRISTDVSQLMNTSSVLDSDEVTKTPVNAWMTNTPLLTPGDVIVDIFDNRYVVQNVIPRTRSQFVVRQVLQLAPLKKGHPAYKLFVDRSVTTL